MPLSPIQLVLDILSKESRPQHDPSEAISFVMDLLHYGEFIIFEQVSSVDRLDLINVAGFKGRSSDEPPLWLVSSVGTGDPAIPSEWCSTGGDPHTPRHDPKTGLIHGLGACSGKVDLVLKIMAASRFMREELTRPLGIIALFGDEGVGTGMPTILEGRSQLPGAALIGAPTNLEIWTAHPGCVVLNVEISRGVRHRRMPPFKGMFEIEVRGRTAHVQSSDPGEDALARGLELLKMLRKVGELRVIRFDAGTAANRTAGHCRILAATSFEQMPSLPPYASATSVDDGTIVPLPVDDLFRAWNTLVGVARKEAATICKGASSEGTPSPRVPLHVGTLHTERDSIHGSVAFWIGPGVDATALCDTLIERMEARLARHEHLSLSVHVPLARPAFTAGEESQELLHCAREALTRAGADPSVGAGLHTTDAGLCHAPAIVYGPGPGLDALYRDDEGIPVSHLETALAFYEQMITAWCVNPE